MVKRYRSQVAYTDVLTAPPGNTDLESVTDRSDPLTPILGLPRIRNKIGLLPGVALEVRTKMKRKTAEGNGIVQVRKSGRRRVLGPGT